MKGIEFLLDNKRERILFDISTWIFKRKEDCGDSFEIKFLLFAFLMGLKTREGSDANFRYALL